MTYDEWFDKYFEKTPTFKKGFEQKSGKGWVDEVTMINQYNKAFKFYKPIK
jgi:hypothetical protein